MQGKHNDELVTLFRSRKAHNRALGLLREMELDDHKRTERIAEYLMQLGAEHVELILEYAKDVFRSDLSLGLELLTTPTYPQVRELPRGRVLQQLKAIAADLPPSAEPRAGPYGRTELLNKNSLCVRYLERICDTFKETDADLHTQLALLYFDLIGPQLEAYLGQCKASDTPPALPGQEPGPLGQHAAHVSVSVLASLTVSHLCRFLFSTWFH